MSGTVSARGAGIVARLRFASLVIVALLLAEAVIGGTLLLRLKRLQDEAANRQLPMLVKASALQADFAGIYLLADQMSRVDVHREMSLLDGRADALFERMKTVTVEMNGLGISAPSLEPLAASIDDVERDLREAFRIARRVVVRSKVLAGDTSRLELLHERFRALVEPAQTEIAYTLRRTLDRIAAADRIGAPESAAIDRSQVARDTLTAISHGVDSIVDLANALVRLGQESGAIDAEAERLRFELRSLPAMLLRLEDSELRRRLAEHLVELRAVVLGETGVLRHERQLAIDRATMSAAQTRLLEAFGGMSTLVNRSVAEVEAAAADTASGLKRATDLTLLVLIATAALALIVILATGYVVLERQVSRRLHVLATEVLRIASGDDGAPVEVVGDDELGKIGRSLKVFRDNARELRRSNEELEKFAYAAAHDMRSPLRAIESLALWTLEDEFDALTEDGRDNLQTLLQRTRRLSTLQTDLLEYAQVGEIDGSFADTDIRSLLVEIHSLVDPDRRFELAVDGVDAPLRTHLVPLRQILMNLVGNAVKHHDRGTGTIAVSWREEHGRLRVEVGDDGPGIEARFHEKIFGLFATLQSKDVVEGSGLGLSMVRKLVERYDGLIEISSDPERARGTRFAFDLPIQAPPVTLARAA